MPEEPRTLENKFSTPQTPLTDEGRIIVIGASAGGFAALKTLVYGLPKELNAAVFIVWHMSPNIKGVLPDVLNKKSELLAGNAVDGEPVIQGRIYVAPPDQHLLLADGRIRVTKGPKENRFRPAIDPLFRSAAYSFGSRVIGIVLSGALDDGSAGLWSVKDRGGIAVVQDPEDAEVPSMPEHALLAVNVDYKLPVSAMARLLVELCSRPVAKNMEVGMDDNERTKNEINIVLQNENNHIMQFGDLTPYTCPECHGVLSALREGDRVRFRCHTGHAFSADSLLVEITENIEENLWSAIRGVEESILLLNHMGDHFAERNQLRLAAVYFKKANEANERVKLVRNAVLNHERLSSESIEEESEQA